MATIKSIEEKAKAYDEALERAIKLKEDPQSVFYEYSPNEGDTICDYIFPELKESKDERILKNLKAVVKAYDMWAERGLDMNDILAWLEKQGKQKETLCDQCKKTQPSHSCQDITALGRCALEKQGEQKLTEFEKAVKQVMEEAIECGDTRNLKADAEMLLSLAHNSSWNEEDKKMFLDIECLIHSYRTGSYEYELSSWLEHLKHRVQPQNTWKPSEEQMEALNYVVNLMASSASPAHNDYYYNVFKNLRKQLKKLRGE